MTAPLAIALSRYEAELLIDALDYWESRLDCVKCESTPHAKAGENVTRNIKRLRARLLPFASERKNA